jgi:hypothetical protein
MPIPILHIVGPTGAPRRRNELMAEGKGFEPLRSLPLAVFKTAALGHYASPPRLTGYRSADDPGSPATVAARGAPGKSGVADTSAPPVVIPGTVRHCLLKPALIPP